MRLLDWLRSWHRRPRAGPPEWGPIPSLKPWPHSEPSTWLELEDVIERLPGFKGWEKTKMIEHLRLERAGSMQRQREREGKNG